MLLAALLKGAIFLRALSKSTIHNDRLLRSYVHILVFESAPALGHLNYSELAVKAFFNNPTPGWAFSIERPRDYYTKSKLGFLKLQYLFIKFINTNKKADQRKLLIGFLFF